LDYILHYDERTKQHEIFNTQFLVFVLMKCFITAIFQRSPLEFYQLRCLGSNEKSAITKQLEIMEDFIYIQLQIKINIWIETEEEYGITCLNIYLHIYIQMYSGSNCSYEFS